MLAQPFEHARMQRTTQRRGKRCIDDAACQFMAEAHLLAFGE